MKKRKKKGIIKYILASLLVFALFFTAGAEVSSYLINDKDKDILQAADESEAIPLEEDGERTNILLLGVDARPGEKNSRSDTMLLVSIDPVLDRVAVISIPRDTKVDISGSSVEKINAANFVGGPDYAVEIVEKVLGINIDYYVEADFNGFKKVVDTIGGVTIDVPQRMYNPYEGINLKPGIQRLNGSQALAFVRFRDYVNGDIDRTVQQQAFIKALADELLQPKTITKLPALIKEVNKYVDTNIPLSQMLKMASWAPGFNSSSITAQTLPGYFYNVYNDSGELQNSFWVVERDKTSSLIEQMLAGQTVAVIQESPYPAYKPPSNSGTQETNDQEPRDDQTNSGNDLDQSDSSDFDVPEVNNETSANGGEHNQKDNKPHDSFDNLSNESFELNNPIEEVPADYYDLF
jgi:LCP family protein required for cell wall assembly